MDTVILLIMLLIINLSAFKFSTSVTVGFAISLIVSPLILLFGVGVKKFLVSKIKKVQPNREDNFSLELRPTAR